ncbi:MAG: chromosomal replication initiator protein DnaA [Deltaproteobacteria bacterium]|nr:chromosomal replication initiator protein DnaA [Deltaproteobacteria bacterium]
MSTLWERTLAELQLVVPSQEFTAWISCLRTAGDPDETLTVEAPSAFHRSWVQRHFLERIRTTVESVAGRAVPVVLAVGTSGAAAVRNESAGTTANGCAPASVSPPPIRIRTATRGMGTHEPSFESFVVGTCNQLAHAAARAVAAAPGRQYNPLCIYGGVGLGKTHLIHAIAGELRARFRSARVLAIGAELFVNEMVSAVRRQQMETFHHRFRRIDTLLVDDVQFIAGKERTQEEFLHTFNLLCAAGKQIVVSSDKPPREIANLEAGLRSRFEGGLMTEVTPPDTATRRGILERKAADAGIVLPADVVAFLAERIRATSVRELEGTLTRIRALASLTGRTIDLALAAEVVGPMRGGDQRHATAERIERLVGAELGVEARALRSPRREARLVFARQVAMFFLRNVLGLSLAAIGERYGRDHTTVLHAVRVVNKRRDRDPEVRRLVSALEEKL